uniref:DacO1 n=1 Tax=Dactylosporangium sp. SC14051 TaxID=1239282 RepID=K4I6A3_9ACTN|nr:DacO1 [Dactylosporangium sp. SC14051]
MLVAGGGPTGLWLAGELRLAGVRPLVLERRTEPFPHSKALGIHPRTIEMLELRGLAGRFLDGAPKLPKGHFASLPVPLDYGAMDTRHPYGVYRKQVETEALLAGHATRLGVPVRRGHELVGLRQHDDAVVGTVQGPQGRYEVRAAYLVGCDGGGSTTRRLAGIDFPGQDPGVAVLMADARFRDPLPSDPAMGPFRRYGVLRPDLRAWFSAIPLPEEQGLCRVMVFWYGRQFEDRRAPVTEDEMRAALVDLAGTDFGMYDVQWLTRFTDASRQAARYRSGRVFLAGDAAHTVFPTGGPGLNAGLQDAMNLGWKLAGAVHGWGGALLDSYHDERYPVAEQVLRDTRTQCLLLDPDPRFVPLRETLAELLRLEPVNRYFTGHNTALAVRYDLGGAHPATGGRMPDVLVATGAGQRRFSDCCVTGRGVLLVTSGADRGELLRGWKDRVDVVTGTVAGPLDAADHLVRPDGYVAWAGGAGHDEPGLETALRLWFGEPVS